MKRSNLVNNHDLTPIFNNHGLTPILKSIILLITLVGLNLLATYCYAETSKTCLKADKEIISLLNSDKSEHRREGYLKMTTGMKEYPTGGWYSVMELPECEYLLIELLKRESSELDKYMEVYGNYGYNDVSAQKKEAEDFLGINEYFDEGYLGYVTDLALTVKMFNNPDIVEPLVNINAELEGLEKYGDRVIEAVIKRLNDDKLFDNTMFNRSIDSCMEYIIRNSNALKTTKYYKEIKNLLIKRLKAKKNDGKYYAVLAAYQFDDKELDEYILNTNSKFDYEPINEKVSIIKKKIKEKRK